MEPSRILVVFAVLTVLCGVQSKPSKKIVGGTPETNVNFVTNIVSKRAGNEDNGYLFSGTLISRTHVLTVAQAVHEFIQWRVGFGSPFNDQMSFLCSTEAIPHPDYMPSTLNNNIAIIVLPFHESTEGIIFPEVNQHLDEPFAYRAYGFGTTNADDIQEVPEVLQTALMFSVPFATCQAFYGDQIVNEGTFCTETAPGLTNFVCYGDQGGPLMHQAFNSIYGITSFWMTCDEEHPFGHVRVGFFFDWISSVISATSQPIMNDYEY